MRTYVFNRMFFGISLACGSHTRDSQSEESALLGKRGLLNKKGSMLISDTDLNRCIIHFFKSFESLKAVVEPQVHKVKFVEYFFNLSYFKKQNCITCGNQTLLLGKTVHAVHGVNLE